MKLRKIEIHEIKHRPLLKNLSIRFADDDSSKLVNPNCIIGVNGSGKSQFLETLAEIFTFLDGAFRKSEKKSAINSPGTFEIEYSILIDSKIHYVSVVQLSSAGKKPKFTVYDENFDEIETYNEIVKFLPNKVIGYTSGDNETISIPFLDYYDEYASYTANRAMLQNSSSQLDKDITDDYEPRFYFMDYNTNQGVVISNLTLGNKKVIAKILELASIGSIRNFQIIFQTKHSQAPGNNGIELTDDHKRWINSLQACATMYNYDPKAAKYTFDFYVNTATINAIEHYFKDAIGFYTALYKLELLNNLIINKKYRTEVKKLRTTRKQLVKLPIVPDQDKVLNYSEIKLRLKNDEIIDYINLSDGEHQLMNIFGTIAMMDSPNCLFLLDEPETHFNPKWRREFVSLCNQIAGNRHQDTFIASHSPFIVSDSKREQVMIFNVENNHLTISRPTKETFGSSFDYILQLAFGLDTTISVKSNDEISDLLESKSIENLTNRLPDFGESNEKFFLYRHLEQLKKDNAL